MIVVVCGVTASGKSRIAQEIATFLKADILNGDAFQVYKHLNIGVNKPSNDIIRKYHYHLIDFLEPNIPFSIADYQRLARKVIEEKLNKNENLVIEGGSGLYLRSLLFDYYFAEKNNEITDNYDSLSNEELYQLLLHRDQLSTNSIHQNNRKRVIRALRIMDETGLTKSEVIDAQDHSLLYKDVYFVALSVERKDLYRKIDERVLTMWDSGLKDEVTSLLNNYSFDSQSLQAIGYKEVIEGIQSGLPDEEIITKIQKNTRHYAKRQITYFKHQLPVSFFDDEESLFSYVRGLKR